MDRTEAAETLLQLSGLSAEVGMNRGHSATSSSQKNGSGWALYTGAARKWAELWIVGEVAQEDKVQQFQTNSDLHHVFQCFRES